MMKSSIVAAAGLFFAAAQGQSSIFSGEGFGTYYYDVDNLDVCGTSFKYQNMGVVECSPQAGLTLDKIDSNHLVAMNHSQLVGDMGHYCGKKVVVSVNGKKSDLPLFIGDGCERCGTGSALDDTWNAEGAPGLDFSYSVFNQLAGGSGCDAGHIAISWEIVDETVHDFSGLGSGQDSWSEPVSNSPASDGPTASAPTMTAAQITPTALAVSPTQTTVVRAISSSVSSDALSQGSTSSSIASGPCSTGAWQCNGRIIERCVYNSWMPIVTCAAGMACHGKDYPLCLPSS